jgi:hypothetical protein
MRDLQVKNVESSVFGMDVCRPVVALVIFLFTEHEGAWIFSMYEHHDSTFPSESCCINSYIVIREALK